MNLKNVVLISSMILGLSACCGGGKKTEPSRWDTPATTVGKGGSGTTPAKTTGTPTATAPPKAEPKIVDPGVVNKFFPEEADGAKRVFKADKAGYAEAEYTLKDKKKLTITINDKAGNADDRGKFKDAKEKISGNPYQTFGKNKSQMLVNDRFQVDVMSQDLDEAARKPWLSKVNMAGLAGLK